MVNPFEVLGVPPGSTPEEVRHAYHLKAKKIHPDQFLDESAQAAADVQMKHLNEAYEEAMKLASARTFSPYLDELSCEEALAIARKLMQQDAPERALRQLLRATSRSADWFNVHGQVLMRMNQYATAEQSFRKALSMDPDNLDYRRGAFDAYAEHKRTHTLKGKLKQMLRIRSRRGTR